MLPIIAFVPVDISLMKGGMSVALNVLGGKNTSDRKLAINIDGFNSQAYLRCDNVSVIRLE
jgi:hypothetical protein